MSPCRFVICNSLAPIASWRALLLGATSAVLAGCASIPRPPQIETVRVCAAGACAPAGELHTRDQLLYALGRLLQVNDGAGMRFCRSEPATRECLGDDVGYFVLGELVLPGRGSSAGCYFRAGGTAGYQEPQYGRPSLKALN